MTRSLISSYENDIRLPSFDILVRLAALFGVTTDYLLTMEERRYVDISCLTDEQAASVIEIVSQYQKCNTALGIVAANIREVV